MAGTITEQINQCLDNKKNFLLSGGAGSGKTYTLIQTLHHVFKKDPKVRVACITYTNVAADEIKKRSPYSKLHVSTIHDFLWGEIKGYQKNLKQTVLDLTSSAKENEERSLSYPDEVKIDEHCISGIEYQNYRDLKFGIISHDDLLKVANYMFDKYPLLPKILCDKYDYIFIDEYQDTQKWVIEIFLKHVKPFAKGSLCLGFFGDKMQSIYETGIGDIQSYTVSGDVCEIVKNDNYRCAFNVIGLLNRLRSDITQHPKKNPDNSIANKIGSATFVYSDNDFDLESFKATNFVSGWNFNNTGETRVLFLTHKLSAIRLGFAELYAAYKYTDNLIGNEPDRLARHLLKIGGVLFYYREKHFSYVIDKIQQKIKTNDDKQKISSALSRLSKNLTISIEEIINEFDKEHIIRKDDRFYECRDKHKEIYDKIKILPASQVLAYFQYYNDSSPFSTQHGIKGAEFDNVLVILDNGGWNKYNFKHYFEDTSGKESIIKRTKRIFYVCCSRAKNNLIVYYPKPTSRVIAKAKHLFGAENVHTLSTL